MPPARLVQSLPLLRSSLREAAVVRKHGYDYFVHPITDGIPRLDPRLLDEVADALATRLPADVDVLLTPEAMGIPLASALSLRTGKPLTVARKRSYSLPGEIAVPQRTGYGASVLHVHGLSAGDRVVVVDDVLSTGGTLRAMVQACRQAKADMRKALVVVNKGVDLERIGSELGVPVEALVGLRIEHGRVVLED